MSGSLIDSRYAINDQKFFNTQNSIAPIRIRAAKIYLGILKLPLYDMKGCKFKFFTLDIIFVLPCRVHPLNKIQG